MLYKQTNIKVFDFVVGWFTSSMDIVYWQGRLKMVIMLWNLLNTIQAVLVMPFVLLGQLELGIMLQSSL